MNKTLPYLGASLTALMLAWSVPAAAQDQFKDLDPNHWAYAAVTDLQQKGILIGYPDGYFKGKRALTRYEFAIALKRALDKIGAGGQGAPGPQGAPGAQGDAGPAGPPGVAPEELDNLKKLVDEFKNELAAQGASIRDINKRLDDMSKDIADIKDQLNHMIKWSGDLFVGTRNDRATHGYIDYSGAIRVNPNTALGGNPSIVNNTNVVHNLDLGVKANLKDGIKFSGDLLFSNYLSYRGNNLASGAFAAQPVGAAGTSTLIEDVVPYTAQLDIPIGGQEDAKTWLTIGRFKKRISRLAYWRPNLDAYFDVPGMDDGNYVQDGADIRTHIGMFGIDLFAANFGSVVTQVGGAFNSPLIGNSLVGVPPGPRTFKPFGIGSVGTQAIANQVAGVGIDFKLGNMAGVNFNAIDLATNAPPPAGVRFNNVIVYDAGAHFRPFGRLHLSAEAAKSVTQVSLDKSDGQNNEDNSAARIVGAWESGPLDLHAGYNYIEPRFGAPGSWMKLGNWYNPVNVMGPFVNVGYKMSDRLDLYAAGQFLSGARNRPGFLTTDDNITQVKGGLTFHLNKTWDLSGDYESLFYSLKGDSTLGVVAGSPIEQYITLGAGLHLTKSTALKLAYQMINFQNSNGAFGAFPGGYNASVLTTQLAVHF